MKRTGLLTKLATIVTAGALLLTGCGSAAAVSGQSQAAAAEPAKEGTTHVVIATSGTGPKPYIWTDENNELQGYDIDVIKNIFSRLPQYDIEFVTTGEVFGGIDAGYYDIACNHFGYNESRGEKYIFSYAYSADPHGILVREDSDIKGLEDLAGHSTDVTAGSNNAIIFEAYNAAHPDAPIILNYTDNAEPYSVVADGGIDFYFFTAKTLEEAVAERGIQGVKVISLTPEEKDAWANTITGNFFIALPEKQQLIDDINAAFLEALADGTIAEIAQKDIGDLASVPDKDYVLDADQRIRANYEKLHAAQ